MTEENKKQEKEEKKEVAEAKKIQKDATEKKESKKDSQKEKKPGKKEATVNGKDLPLSRKHCIALCNFIRGKKIEQAINILQEVIKMKKAVPMKGEIPHRKGKIMSGRYPIRAAERFIKMLKQLSANAVNHDLDLDKGVIECKTDPANRPHRRFGRMKFKRCHVRLKLVMKKKLKKKKLKKI